MTASRKRRSVYTVISLADRDLEADVEAVAEAQGISFENILNSSHRLLRAVV